MGEQTLSVVATVNLRGLRAGEVAIVDPHDPYVQELLTASFLVPVGQTVEPDPEPPMSLTGVVEPLAVEEPAEEIAEPEDPLLTELRDEFAKPIEPEPLPPA